MVDSSKIRRASPFIAFLFARLGALVDSRSDTLGVVPSSNPYPYIGDFMVASSGLGSVLGELYPLLRNSLVWFKSIREALRRENMGSEMGSDNLERDLSSDVGTVGARVDTATFAPSGAPSSSHPPVSGEVHSFHAFKKKCSLKIEVFNKLRDIFQFPDETRARLPRKVRRLVPLPIGKFVSMRLRFCAASGFSSILSSWSFFII